MELVDGGGLYRLHFFVSMLESDGIYTSVVLFYCKCALLFNFLFKLRPVSLSLNHYLGCMDIAILKL
jgi:hypothetical protein